MPWDCNVSFLSLSFFLSLFLSGSDREEALAKSDSSFWRLIAFGTQRPERWTQRGPKAKLSHATRTHYVSKEAIQTILHEGARVPSPQPSFAFSFLSLTTQKFHVSGFHFGERHETSPHHHPPTHLPRLQCHALRMGLGFPLKRNYLIGPTGHRSNDNTLINLSNDKY